MLALALALCNADRVVMSVAIVPMSAARGWSRSFAGVVQVDVVVFFPPLCFYTSLAASYGITVHHLLVGSSLVN